MDFDKAIKNIDRALVRKQPTSFNSPWIKRNCRTTYFYISENIKNEFDVADWDLVVSKLDRLVQKRWMKGARKGRKYPPAYEDEAEVQVLIKKYQSKLYTFITQVNAEDRAICDWISIKLVRVAQSGNLVARNQATMFATCLVEQWLESDIKIGRWRGNSDLVEEKIHGCIKRFRYAGSFIGYLYRTLEYAGRGLRGGEAYSLDDCYTGTTKKKVDNAVYDNETGETRMTHRKSH